MRAHKHASFAVVLALVAAVSLTAVIIILGSTAGPAALTDASTCSQWRAAGPARQTAYSRRYVDEHGEAGFLSVPAVTSAIGRDCQRAAYLGESDDMSVVGAMKHAF